MKKIFLQLFLFLTSMLLAQTNPDAFIFKYNITDANQAISFNIGDSTKTFDYNVDWGDGTTNTNQSASADHTYAIPGEYTVSITGVYPSLKFSLNPIISIEQWGTNEWESCVSMFGRNRMLTSINATDIPNFAPGVSLESMFIDCNELEANINNWDVSNVTNMSSMFLNAFKFNSPLDKWNVSNVTLMTAMFNNAEAFNQSINKWNVSNVTNMTSMFEKAESFNTSINNWNVSKVKDMRRMFSEATKFNQALNDWDVSNVTLMTSMFNDAESFNQALNNWDVSNVTIMGVMFNNAKLFNQPLDNWNVSKVINMDSMFSNTESFNQDISNWNVTSLESVSAMFENALEFNQPIGNWDMSNIKSFENDFVFNNAASFDQSLENWYPRQGSGVSIMFDYLTGSGISSENYTKTLLAWAKAADILNGTGVRVFNFGAVNVDYCDDALIAINILENDLNWRLDHGNIDPNCTGATLSTLDFDTIAANEMYFNYNTNTLDITVEDEANLKVYDLLGREVMNAEIKSGTTTETLNELQPAIYIARLKSINLGSEKFLKVILN